MKIIDKILDEYYSKKLIEKIDCEIRGRFYCDIKTQKSGEGYIISIKRTEYNDLKYQELCRFLKKEAFIKLTTFNTKVLVDLAGLILRE